MMPGQTNIKFPFMPYNTYLSIRASGYYIYQLRYTQENQNFAHIVYLCASCYSGNEERLFL